MEKIQVKNRSDTHMNYYIFLHDLLSSSIQNKNRHNSQRYYDARRADSLHVTSVMCKNRFDSKMYYNYISALLFLNNESKDRFDSKRNYYNIAHILNASHCKVKVKIDLILKGITTYIGSYLTPQLLSCKNRFDFKRHYYI